MRLNEITDVTLLRDSLEALADLERKYKGEELVGRFKGGCPLCRLFNTRKTDERNYDCERDQLCPWWWIEGCLCSAAGYFIQPISARIRRISRWRGLINARIAELEAS